LEREREPAAVEGVGRTFFPLAGNACQLPGVTICWQFDFVTQTDLGPRVARWFVFRPKIPNFGGPLNGKCCIFYYHLEYFMAIWYNLGPFGMVCGHLLYFPQLGVYGQRKIWQP
jgi:hypothetical protein